MKEKTAGTKKQHEDVRGMRNRPAATGRSLDVLFLGLCQAMCD